jgi:TRAP-type C4-dicarboxylate transport system permease small subunit
MNMLSGLVRWANRVLMFAAGVFMIAMIALTCANILLRTFWVPIDGTFELMGYFGAVVTAFALGYTQKMNGHIAVDVLFNLFPRRGKLAIQALNHTICLIFFGMVAWRISRYASTLWSTGEITETLGIIYYPFVYCVALGCAVLALVFLIDLIGLFLPTQEENK